MTWQIPDKNWLLENLVDLILDETITSNERDIFVSNKTQLEKSQNDRAVAASLKDSLSLLAVERQLTSASTKFLV
ncbi:bacteriocin immunity protein [Leuconostoc pseudomesenteroides]